MASTPSSLAERGQRLGLKLIAKAGGLPALQDPERRKKVERLLYRGAVSGFKAQTAAGRAFAKKKGSGDPERAAARPPKQMFDLTPDEDQATIKQVAKDLADEMIRPIAAESDANRSVPDDVRAAATEMGLGLVGVPASLEGIAEERSAVTAAIVLEELARGDLGIATSIMAPAAVAAAIAAYGDADQQATYLPEFTGEKPPVAALALHEPQPLFDPFALRTTGKVEGDEIVYHGEENLSIAVDTERGLLTPVVKHAGDLNIAGLARAIADVADRTRTNKITPDDLSGGTFTITNTGSRGALFDTPILNQPQVGMLGTGAIVKRPVVVTDADGGETIAVRSMMYLAMSYDHRVVDGADAARFLGTVKDRLEGGAFEV